MADIYQVLVYENQELTCRKECDAPLELGRQDPNKQEALYQIISLGSGASRLVIAPKEAVSISRQNAWIEPLEAGWFGVKNLSGKVSFSAGNNRLGKSRMLKPGQRCELESPVALVFGTTSVCLHADHDGGTSELLQSLEEQTRAPSTARTRSSDLGQVTTGTSPDLPGEQVIRWLQAAMDVLQSAATDSDFFQKAAQAVVDLVGMDSGRVLIRDHDEWQTMACALADPGSNRIEPPSRLVLRRVCATKKTSWFDPGDITGRVTERATSLTGINSAVASPILNRQGEVIAALYAERRFSSALALGRNLSRVDAMVVELLAGGVAAGLARLEQEGAAVALQTQFEQFFTPTLARELAARPELLDGKDATITMLFCDIRGFSRISRNLGPAMTLEWVGDVLSTLSDCVLDRHGVLVDYQGDALMAMWGAPRAQDDDAEQACRAALEMLAHLPDLSRRWQETLGEPMGLSVGINTGLARVGNSGSRRKFKYGPLGDTVNVASRVQGAAKYFKTSLLLTRATREQIGPELPCRRLGLARLQNIAEPVDLYELFPAGDVHSDRLSAAYEDALAAFESGEFRAAARALGRLVNDYPDDGPTYALLARAVTCMVEEPESFDPAFRLPGK